MARVVVTVPLALPHVPPLQTPLQLPLQPPLTAVAVPVEQTVLGFSKGAIVPVDWLQIFQILQALGYRLSWRLLHLIFG